jgi:hypothetical protein
VPELDETGKSCTDSCPSGLPCIGGICGGSVSGEAGSDVVTGEGGVPDGDGGQDSQLGQDVLGDSNGGSDVDAGPRCDITKDFGAPAPIVEINTADEDAVADLSPDETTMYVATNHFATGMHLYTTTRASPTAPWPALASMFPVGAYDDWDVTVSPNGLVAVLSSDRSGTNDELYFSKRTSTTMSFTSVVAATALNSTADEQTPQFSDDGNTIYFDSSRAGTRDLYWATVTSGTAFGTPTPITELNTSALEAGAVLSKDELTIYFLSGRAPSPEGDIYTAKRATKSSPFGIATQVTSLNSSALDGPTWLSPDGCVIYIISTRGSVGGHFDSFVARRPL